MTKKPLPKPSIVEVFEQVDPTILCWYWTGLRNPDGYGIHQRLRAHRLVYEALVGPIPDGLVLDHLCRVRHCVNPDHLEPVSIQENVRRAFRSQARCKHGHEYTKANTYRCPKGRRRCRACMNKRYLRQKEARRNAKADA